MQRVRVFVASPGDVQAEREHLARVINEINLTQGARDDFHLELLSWRTHVFPEMGREPQEVINQQIGEYDIFVGILWGRFGTPTSKAESGTKEEFDKAYAAYKEGRVKHILFYFCDAPPPITLEDLEQIRKVLLFRSQLENEGLIGTYPSSEHFADRIRPDLIRVVVSRILPLPQQQATIRQSQKKPGGASSKEYVIGVDIGATKIAAAVVQLGTMKPTDDKDVYTLPLPAGATGNAELVLSKAYDHISKTIAKTELGWDKIAGIGVGLPGQVDVPKGILKFSPGLKVENVPFRTRLKRNFQDMVDDTFEIRLDNDARCAARCELYLGLGKSIAKQRSHFVVIFIGTGVGSGIVVDGKMYYGARSCAGEIGHTKISAVGPPCNCGATGCLETFVTGPAIVRIAKERALAYTRRHRTTQLSDYGDLTTVHIAEALKQRDEAALEVAQEVGELLGEGIANYANVFNPELVILGGGVIVGFYDYLSTHIRRGFDRQALREVRGTSIVPSDFEKFGPVLGAALLFHPDEARQE